MKEMLQGNISELRGQAYYYEDMRLWRNMSHQDTSQSVNTNQTILDGNVISRYERFEWNICLSVFPLM